MKQVLEEYGIDTHVTVSMKGSIAGDMSQYDKSEVSGRMLKMLGAKTVTTDRYRIHMLCMLTLKALRIL